MLAEIPGDDGNFGRSGVALKGPDWIYPAQAQLVILAHAGSFVPAEPWQHEQSVCKFEPLSSLMPSRATQASGW